MPDQNDPPEPSSLPTATEIERPLTSAEKGLAASLKHAMAGPRAADALSRIHDTSGLDILKRLNELDRTSRAIDAAFPRGYTAAEAAKSAAAMQAAYTRTMGLGPSINTALAALGRTALENTSALSPLWLSRLDAATMGSAIPKIPAELLGNGLHQGLAEQFERLTRPALSVARILVEAERRQQELAAVLEPSRAARAAWEAVAQLNDAATRTWDYLGTRPDQLALISPRLAGTPVIEVYSATHAATLVTAADEADLIETVTELEAELDDIGDAFESRLASLDPALVAMYRGGVERVERGGTDWARQALTSFRELTTHALHLLAPDEEVAPWARPQHFANGRLTRRARLEFIVREVASGDLADFLKMDLNSTLALFDLMHTVHKKTPALDQRQLRLLYNRIRGAISALLEAAGR